jgi:hypothetical protein
VLVEAMPCSQFSQFAMRDQSAEQKQSQTVARMLNCLPHTLVLPRGIKVATVQNINVAASCEPFKVPSPRTEADCLESEQKLTHQEIESICF